MGYSGGRSHERKVPHDLIESGAFWCSGATVRVTERHIATSWTLSSLVLIVTILFVLQKPERISASSIA